MECGWTPRPWESAAGAAASLQGSCGLGEGQAVHVAVCVRQAARLWLTSSPPRDAGPA